MITQELRDAISKLPKELATQAWANHFKINPFDMIREGILYIKTDRQEIIRLIPKPVQFKLLDYIEDKWINNKPCYIVIPKARRTGVSTIIEAILYVLTSQIENTSAIIIANKSDNSENIFEMSKIYHEKLLPDFKPEKKRSNKKELYFDKIHSKIVVDTAKNKNVGQSWAFQLIHLSEVAYFDNPKTITTGLFQTLPDNMFTLVALESTGNGIGGYFHDKVLGAKNGTNDYKLFFFAWYEKPENTMPIDDPDNFELQTEGSYGNEVVLKKKYDLTDEQINWRRYTIKNKCNNNIKTFMQEHPSNLKECFQASGVNAFNIEKLNEIELDARKPRWTGILEEEDGKVVFREDVNGWLQIWEKPDTSWDYLYNLSLDTGGVWENSDKDCADWSSAIVRNRLKRMDVAQFHLHAPAHVIAKRAILLARYYNNCRLVPEINKWTNEIDDQGEPVLNYLRDRYSNVYYRKTYDTKEEEWTKKIGFHTNKQTKKMLIEKGMEWIDNYDELGENLNDIEITKEFQMYVTNDEKGVYEATQGEKDDRVMSYLINLLTCDELPAPRKKQRQRPYRRTRDTGLL